MESALRAVLEDINLFPIEEIDILIVKSINLYITTFVAHKCRVLVASGRFLSVVIVRLKAKSAETATSSVASNRKRSST